MRPRPLPSLAILANDGGALALWKGGLPLEVDEPQVFDMGGLKRI